MLRLRDHARICSGVLINEYMYLNILLGGRIWRLEAYLSTEIATNSLFLKKTYDMHPTAYENK